MIHIVLCATYFYYLLKYFSYYLYEQQVLSGVYSMPSSDEKTEYLLTLLLVSVPFLCVISRPFWGIMFIMYFWYFSLSSWRFHWFFSFSCISIRCDLILRPMRMQKDKLFAMYFFPLPVYASRIIMQTSLWVCSLLWWHNPLGWIFVLFAWNSSCTPVNMYIEQIWFPSVLVILIRFFRTGSKSSSPTIL